MLEAVSMWFNQLRTIELHSYVNELVSSGVGLFLLVPIAGAVCIALYQALRR